MFSRLFPHFEHSLAPFLLVNWHWFVSFLCNWCHSCPKTICPLWLSVSFYNDPLRKNWPVNKLILAHLIVLLWPNASLTLFWLLNEKPVIDVAPSHTNPNTWFRNFYFVGSKMGGRVRLQNKTLAWAITSKPCRGLWSGHQPQPGPALPPPWPQRANLKEIRNFRIVENQIN